MSAPQTAAPSQQPAPSPAAAVYIPRVIVKFRDDVSLPYEDHVEKYFEARGIGPWAALLAQFPGITVNRLFISLSPKQIQDLVSKAVANDPTYAPPNFLTYFAVDCPPRTDRAALARQLAKWPSVQLAYAEGRPGNGPSVNPTDDTRTVAGLQGYVDPAPGGVDARFAWAKLSPGGAGEGIGFVDLEQGWTLNHEDLAAAGITFLDPFSVNYTDFDHGTKSLGVVLAVDNDRGDVGIATHAQGKVISEWRPLWDRPDTILTAAFFMNAGDVLLLEVAYSAVGCENCLPVEIEEGVFQLIRLATALGIIVIEPAGNGAFDLDAPDASGQYILQRDSRAIIVAAADSFLHGPMVFTCYGYRVDCYAWGENVDAPRSTWTLNNYTNSYGGTSSASAIVAGVATVIQSAAVAQGYGRQSPLQLRGILRNPANGTPSEHPVLDRIKAMPDLRKILINEFGVVP